MEVKEGNLLRKITTSLRTEEIEKLLAGKDGSVCSAYCNGKGNGECDCRRDKGKGYIPLGATKRKHYCYKLKESEQLSNDN